MRQALDSQTPEIIPPVSQPTPEPTPTHRSGFFSFLIGCISAIYKKISVYMQKIPKTETKMREEETTVGSAPVIQQINYEALSEREQIAFLCTRYFSLNGQN